MTARPVASSSWWTLTLVAARDPDGDEGARQSLGLFVSPLNTETGLASSRSLRAGGRAVVWGAVQPIAARWPTIWNGSSAAGSIVGLLSLRADAVAYERIRSHVDDGHPVAAALAARASQSDRRRGAQHVLRTNAAPRRG